MISNQYYNKKEKIPYIDISNSSSYSDDDKNTFIIQQTEQTFNNFNYSLPLLVPNKKGNEISLNQNNISYIKLSTKKNLSINFKILKRNSSFRKKKASLDFSLLKKAKEICLKIKKRKIKKLKIINKDSNIASYDFKKNIQIENIQYYSPIKKSFSDYNKIKNSKLKYKKKSILSINNYQGKNLMEIFDKIENVNKEEQNTIKNFSPNYIKKESKLEKKYGKTSILSSYNNIQLKSLNINYSKKFKINNINKEQIKKSTNFGRKPIKSTKYNYKPKKKFKRSLSFNNNNILLCKYKF